MPIQTLSDLKKNSAPKGNPGGGPGGPPGGGFFGGFGGGEPASGPESKNIKHISGSDSVFANELKKAGGKLVVVDFTATWCGPCKRIAPVFSQLADEFPQVVFIKIDVDQSPDIASSRGVRSMPTFQFYKNGTKIAEFSGADPSRLRSEIEKNKTSDSSSSSSSAPQASNMSGGSYMLGGSAENPNPQRPLSERPPPPQFDDDEEDDDDLLRKFGKKKSTGSSAKAEVNPVFLINLKDMGFTTSQSTKALQATGGKNLEAAMDWCLNHPQDAEEAEKERAAEEEAAKNAPEKAEGEATPMEGVTTTEPEPQKPQLTEEEKKAKLDELLRKRREAKAKDEEDRQKERELARRAQGKDVTDAKKKWEDGKREREELARKKEKEADAKAKADIKAKLEQDRAERAAAAAARSGASVPTPAPVAAPVAVEKKEYTEALIQIRFQDGSNIKAKFKPDDTIQTVHDHVASLSNKSDFGLLSTFPKKLYTPLDKSSLSTTLKDAGFVPSGTLMVTAQ